MSTIRWAVYWVNIYAGSSAKTQTPMTYQSDAGTEADSGTFTDDGTSTTSGTVMAALGYNYTSVRGIHVVAILPFDFTLTERHWWYGLGKTAALPLRMSSRNDGAGTYEKHGRIQTAGWQQRSSPLSNRISPVTERGDYQ
jgi:hypothetical protein